MRIHTGECCGDSLLFTRNFMILDRSDRLTETEMMFRFPAAYGGSQSSGLPRSRDLATRDRVRVGSWTCPIRERKRVLCDESGESKATLVPRLATTSSFISSLVFRVNRLNRNLKPRLAEIHTHTQREHSDQEDHLVGSIAVASKRRTSKLTIPLSRSQLIILLDPIFSLLASPLLRPSLNDV